MFLVDNDILLSLFLPSASLSVCEERPEVQSGQNCDVALFSDGNVTDGWQQCGGDGRQDDGQVKYCFQRLGLPPLSSLFWSWPDSCHFTFWIGFLSLLTFMMFHYMVVNLASNCD